MTEIRLMVAWPEVCGGRGRGLLQVAQSIFWEMDSFYINWGVSYTGTLLKLIYAFY